MRGFAVTAADNAIVAAAAKYRPEKRKNRRVSGLKMTSSAARVREFRARIRRRSMLVTIEVRNDSPS